MRVKAEKAVIKLGSESNTDGSGIRRERLAHYTSQIAERAQSGHQQVVTLSGAIATANAVLLNKRERADKRITPQMRATRGNAAFFDTWIRALDQRGVRAGEILVTHHELDYKPETESFIHTIEDYLDAGWVPLINENGSTDDKETKKLKYGGDNDGLAKEVADRIEADRIYFLTEVEGVFGADGKLIRVVDSSNIGEVLEAVGEAGVPGPGAGMRSKVDAAWSAAEKGRTAHIAYAGYNFEPIRNGTVGTLFVPH
jgi:glutamate 5-kinase